MGEWGPYIAAVLSAFATYLATFLFEKGRDRKQKSDYKEFLIGNLLLHLKKVVENLESLKLSQNTTAYYPLQYLNNIESSKTDLFEILKNLISVDQTINISDLRDSLDDVYTILIEIRFLENFIGDKRKEAELKKKNINIKIEKLKELALNHELIYTEDSTGGAPEFEAIGKKNIKMSNFFIGKLMALRTQLQDANNELSFHEEMINKRRTTVLPQIVDVKSSIRSLIKDLEKQR